MASSQPAPTAHPQLSFAGLGRRLGAYFLDVLIAASILFIAGFTMRGLRAAGLWTPATGGLPPDVTWRGLGIALKLAVIIGFVLSLGGGPIYSALFESSPWQATFGKRLLDIYVSDNEGKRISVARAFGRWFTKYSFNYFLLWAVSMGTIAGTKRKQALHDFVADTVVMRGRPPGGGSLEPWRIVVTFGIPYVWLLATFVAAFWWPGLGHSR